MRRFSGWILGLLAVLAGLYPSLEEAASRTLYLRLTVGEPVRSADLVAVLGGGGGGRIRRGLQLVELGYAPSILFLGSTPELQFASSLARRDEAWAPGRVRFATEDLRSTRACVDHLVEHCRRQRVGTVLVVSDSWHLARVQALLASHGELGFEPVMVPAWRPPDFASQGGRRNILREGLAYAVTRLTEWRPSRPAAALD